MPDEFTREVIDYIEELELFHNLKGKRVEDFDVFIEKGIEDVAMGRKRGK